MLFKSDDAGDGSCPMRDLYWSTWSLPVGIAVMAPTAEVRAAIAEVSVATAINMEVYAGSVATELKYESSALTMAADCEGENEVTVRGSIAGLADTTAARMELRTGNVNFILTAFKDTRKYRK